MHPVILVHRDRADRSGAQPEHVGGAADHDVRLGRGVQGHRPGGGDARLAHGDPEAIVARALQRDEVGHRAAGQHQPGRRVGQPEAPGEPAREVQLDLRRRRGQPEGARVRVDPGGEQLGGRRGHGSRTHDVRDEPGVARCRRTARRSPRADARAALRRPSAPRARAGPRRARRPRPSSAGSRAASGSRSSSSAHSSTTCVAKARARSGSQARSVTGSGRVAMVRAVRGSAASWRAGSRRGSAGAWPPHARGGRARRGSRRGRSRGSPRSRSAPAASG